MHTAVSWQMTNIGCILDGLVYFRLLCNTQKEFFKCKIKHPQSTISLGHAIHLISSLLRQHCVCSPADEVVGDTSLCLLHCVKITSIHLSVWLRRKCVFVETIKIFIALLERIHFVLADIFVTHILSGINQQRKHGTWQSQTIAALCACLRLNGEKYILRSH